MKTVLRLCAGESASRPKVTGLTTYLAKPYNTRDLLEMIRRLLPEGQGADG